MNRGHAYPMFLALLAALLFGASAPLSKLLLEHIEPTLLAALLYLGSGFGLLIMRMVQQRDSSAGVEARIGRSDLPWLVGATIAGGIAAPIVLLHGLRDTPAATASLLLNLEAAATTVIAALLFRESVSRRAAMAILIITAASLLLSLNMQAAWGFSLGAAGILLACVLWGIDNNFTRNVSAKDPLTIVTIKSLAAGTCSLIIATLAGASLPEWKTVFGGLLLGAVCYGLSLILFVRALRELGAARTSALFGTAPLAGVALSVLLLGENLGARMLLGLVLMAAGTVMLLRERHEHDHVHEAAAHEHAHSHDDGHHVHEHETLPAGPVHSHAHAHAEVMHAHGHLPDIHHRHSHPARPSK